MLGEGGGVAKSVLPVSWLHEVTGADLGPDGRLYLVLREYSDMLAHMLRKLRSCA